MPLSTLATYTPTQAGIISDLLPNGWTLLAHIVATLILLTVLIVLVWRPLNQMLARRREYVEGQIAETEQARAIALAEADAAKLVTQQARIDSARIVEAARLEGYKMREELEVQAKMYADRIKQDARDDIKKQEEQLRSRLNDEIVTVALMAAERVIGDKISQTGDRDMVNAFVKQIESEQNVG